MTVATINPSASNHDAWQDGPGVMELTGLIELNAAARWGGLFLSAVPVASADALNSATLYYKPFSSTRDSPTIDWYIQATDNAAVFTTTASNISSRSRSTAMVNDTAANIGTATYRAIDITSLVDEVRARPGWTPGNNMALIADCQSGSDIFIQSYDNGSNIWYVEIDYTAAGGGGGVTLKSMYYARVREG
jgi:hypothetical protein